MMAGTSLRRIPYPVLVALFSVLLVLVWVFSLVSGSLRIPFTEVVAVLTGGGEAMYRQILLDFRLPRLLTAGLSGIALAVSGSLLQNAVRNPLGDPQVIGVTSGAGAGALLLMVGFPQLSAGWVPVGAVIGEWLPLRWYTRCPGREGFTRRFLRWSALPSPHWVQPSSI